MSLKQDCVLVGESHTSLPWGCRAIHRSKVLTRPRECVVTYIVNPHEFYIGAKEVENIFDAVSSTSASRRSWTGREVGPVPDEVEEDI